MSFQSDRGCDKLSEKFYSLKKEWTWGMTYASLFYFLQVGFALAAFITFIRVFVGWLSMPFLWLVLIAGICSYLTRNKAMEQREINDDTFRKFENTSKEWEELCFKCPRYDDENCDDD